MQGNGADHHISTNILQKMKKLPNRPEEALQRCTDAWEENKMSVATVAAQS